MRRDLSPEGAKVQDLTPGLYLFLIINPGLTPNGIRFDSSENVSFHRNSVKH